MAASPGSNWQAETEVALLAVDLGLRCGLACFDRQGNLRWYRSSNFGQLPRMKRAIPGILRSIENLQWLVIEGGGPLAEPWLREAERRQLRVRQISAETWRRQLLLNREQRSGSAAKHHADSAARRIISASGAKKPTSLRHDAAEAILAGFYVVTDLGWLPKEENQACSEGKTGQKAGD